MGNICSSMTTQRSIVAPERAPMTKPTTLSQKMTPRQQLKQLSTTTTETPFTVEDKAEFYIANTISPDVITKRFADGSLHPSASYHLRKRRQSLPSRPMQKTMKSSETKRHTVPKIKTEENTIEEFFSKLASNHCKLFDIDCEDKDMFDPEARTANLTQNIPLEYIEQMSGARDEYDSESFDSNSISSPEKQVQTELGVPVTDRETQTVRQRKHRKDQQNDKKVVMQHGAIVGIQSPHRSSLEQSVMATPETKSQASQSMMTIPSEGKISHVSVKSDLILTDKPDQPSIEPDTHVIGISSASGKEDNSKIERIPKEPEQLLGKARGSAETVVIAQTEWVSAAGYHEEPADCVMAPINETAAQSLIETRGDNMIQFRNTNSPTSTKVQIIQVAPAVIECADKLSPQAKVCAVMRVEGCDCNELQGEDSSDSEMFTGNNPHQEAVWMRDARQAGPAQYKTPLNNVYTNVHEGERQEYKGEIKHAGTHTYYEQTLYGLDDGKELNIAKESVFPSKGEKIKSAMYKTAHTSISEYTFQLNSEIISSDCVGIPQLKRMLSPSLVMEDKGTLVTDTDLKLIRLTNSLMTGPPGRLPPLQRSSNLPQINTSGKGDCKNRKKSNGYQVQISFGGRKCPKTLEKTCTPKLSDEEYHELIKEIEDLE